MNRKLRSLFLAGTGTVLALVPIAAQNPTPESAAPAPFGEVLDVRVVNIEVVVTDRDGVRVHALGPQDFRLRVDGQETPIDYFTEVRGGAAILAAGPDAGRVESVPAIAPGSPVGTSYLVFIDEFFSIERDRDKVLDSLIAELPLLSPEDRMAVVAWDGRELEMLSSWSNSVAALDRVFKEAERRPAKGLQRLAERRNFELTGRPSLRRRGTFERMDTLSGLSPEERIYATQLASQLKSSVSAATATLRSFAQPPGRKVMLLLSGGWPFSPSRYTANDFTRALQDYDVEGGSDLYQSLADAANLLGYTLYPVDVPGMQADTVDASQDSPGEPGSGGFLSRENEVHESLTFLANETGGRALINAGARRAFETAAEDTRSYYWLGFRPTRKGDNQRHDVQVEVLRPGLRVRSRDGFLDFSRQAEVSMAVESALLFGSAPGDQALQVQLGAPVKSGIGKVKVPLDIAIPTAALTVLPVGGKPTAQIELRIAAMDDGGGRSDIPVIPLTLELGEPRPAYVRYTTTLELRKRPHDLVVAVHDVPGGAIVSARVSYKP